MNAWKLLIPVVTVAAIAACSQGQGGLPAGIAKLEMTIANGEKRGSCYRLGDVAEANTKVSPPMKSSIEWSGAGNEWTLHLRRDDTTQDITFGRHGEYMVPSRIATSANSPDKDLELAVVNLISFASINSTPKIEGCIPKATA